MPADELAPAPTLEEKVDVLAAIVARSLNVLADDFGSPYAEDFREYEQQVYDAFEEIGDRGAAETPAVARGRTTFPPVKLEVDAEALIDAIGHLYALEEILLDLNRRQESETTDDIGETASSLLRLLAPMTAYGGEIDFDRRSDYAVEAFARGYEEVAEHYESLGLGAERYRIRAGAIRQHRHVFAGHMSEAELRYELAGGGHA